MFFMVFSSAPRFGNTVRKQAVVRKKDITHSIREIFFIKTPPFDSSTSPHASKCGKSCYEPLYMTAWKYSVEQVIKTAAYSIMPFSLNRGFYRHLPVQGIKILCPAVVFPGILRDNRNPVLHELRLYGRYVS